MLERDKFNDICYNHAPAPGCSGAVRLGFQVLIVLGPLPCTAVHDRYFDPEFRLQPPPMTPQSVMVCLLVVDAARIDDVRLGCVPSVRSEVARMG